MVGFWCTLFGFVFTWQKFSPISLTTLSVKTPAEKNSDGL